NTAIGTGALFGNTTGADNTAIGDVALVGNTTGVSNTAVGTAALASNTTAQANTATGYEALFTNTTGASNTAIGDGALYANTTGSGNTALGYNAGIAVTTANNVICIGSEVIGSNTNNNTCFIGNIVAVTTELNDAVPVVVATSNQLGTVSSSRRFKKEIKPMENSSEAILALKPVTFHYKSDKMNRPEFGLIAEEVAEVNPDLVVHDKYGQIYSVRYEAVNAMLLNEFLKEHATVQELKKEITELKAGLQKVSAQFEVSERARQVAGNNQ